MTETIFNSPHLISIFQFSGHAVIPSLARDMLDPTQFDRMINWAFVSSCVHISFSNILTQYQVAATFLYALIGYAGYLMFGNAVSDEVSPSHLCEIILIAQNSPD